MIPNYKVKVGDQMVAVVVQGLETIPRPFASKAHSQGLPTIYLPQPRVLHLSRTIPVMPYKADHHPVNNLIKWVMTRGRYMASEEAGVRNAFSLIAAGGPPAFQSTLVSNEAFKAFAMRVPPAPARIRAMLDTVADRQFTPEVQDFLIYALNKALHFYRDKCDKKTYHNVQQLIGELYHKNAVIPATAPADFRAGND